MSQTFSIVCHETKQRLWIGQGWGGMTTFYAGDPKIMASLGRFLETTRGKNLIVLCNDDDVGDVLEYEEFEEPESEA